VRYVGQRKRTFSSRCKEYKQAIITNKQDSRYAQHVLDTGHAYDTREDTQGIFNAELKAIS
jgi:hypothetical protein